MINSNFLKFVLCYFEKKHYILYYHEKQITNTSQDVNSTTVIYFMYTKFVNNKNPIFLYRTFNIYGNRYDVHNKQVEIASQSDIILYKTQKLEFDLFISSPMYLYLTECTFMASKSKTFSIPFNLLKTCSFYTRPHISKIQLESGLLHLKTLEKVTLTCEEQ